MSNRTCSVDTCNRDVRSRGYCQKHYRRLMRTGSTERVLAKEQLCAIDGCERYQYARSWCRKHYGRWYATGTTDLVLEVRYCSIDGCERIHTARGMCSMHWRRWARATGREKNPVWDERRKANWKKRYALTRGASDAESFDYIEIYDRDNWICGICDEPVDPSLEWPDPMSVSLDHVVPVTRGGSHTRDNSQCSHLGCNLSKGNSVQVDAMST